MIDPSIAGLSAESEAAEAQSLDDISVTSQSSGAGTVSMGSTFGGSVGSLQSQYPAIYQELEMNMAIEAVMQVQYFQNQAIEQEKEQERWAEQQGD